MKKLNKKKIIIAVLVILGLLGVYKIVDATSYHFVKAKADIYLCMKYNAKPSEFELVDYKPAHMYGDDYNIFYYTPKWSDFSFEYKYKDKNFFVNRYKGDFYDDYQLDDIQKWCTEWLQEYVDKRIVGVDFTGIGFVGITNRRMTSASDSEKFIKNYSLHRKDGVDVFIVWYRDITSESIQQSQILRNEMNTKLNSNLETTANVEAAPLESYLVKVPIKNYDTEWRQTYWTKEQFESMHNN